MMRKTLRTSTTLVAFLVLLLPAVDAWGRQGHEIIGNLAWYFLSQKTQAQIMNIVKVSSDLVDRQLASDCQHCTPLGEIADWADAVRRHYPWSSPLHYIDVRDDTIDGGCPAGANDNISPDCHFDYERDCPENACVAGSVVNYTAIVHRYDTVEHPQDLLEPLKFLTHFVGDIHQPLHASRTTDRGGNSIHVKFDDDKPPPNTPGRRQLRTTTHNLRRRSQHYHANNLHAVWDDSIIEKCMRDDFDDSRVALEKSLFDWIHQHPLYAKAWLKCPNGASVECTTLWGQESFAAAMEWAYRNVNGTEIADGTHLTTDYYTTRLPIVHQRLLAAGLRLAATLEIALQGDGLDMTILQQ